MSLKRRLAALERSLPPENIGLKLLTRVIREYDTGDAATIDGLRAEVDAAPAEDGQLLLIARALLEVDPEGESGMTLKRRIAKLEEAGQYITMPNPRYMTDEQLEDWCNYFQWADPEAWAAPPTLTEAEVERELKRTTWPTKYYPPPWPGGKREP